MKRRKFTSDFKAKVAIEAIKGQKTTSELSQKHKLHVQQISNWKREFLDNASLAFGGESKANKSKEEQERDELLRTIGELKVENDYLKKKLK